jgi:predicted restriction endonuclease
MGPGEAFSGPGLARYVFATKSELYKGLDRVWRLSASLPSAPLHEFEVQTAALPRNTEAERWVIQRVGQDVFRAALMKYWNGSCPLTGIAEPELLRASHIVAWADCDDDAHRLDVHNGLLLSALWDAAFDKGLVSFTDDGSPLYAARLSKDALALMASAQSLTGRLANGHRHNLARHRLKFGFDA